MIRIAEFNMSENPGDRKWGVPGDQLKTEAEAQEPVFHGELQIVWYYGGWDRAFRAVDPIRADCIAEIMEKACRNLNVGYSQYNGAAPRTSFYHELLAAGCDAALIDTPCNGDCSSGVMAAINAAYGAGTVPEDLYTGTERDLIMATGEFMELFDVREETLKRGDIVLKKGHTAVILDYPEYISVPMVCTGNTWLRTMPDTSVKSRYVVYLKGDYVNIGIGAKNQWRIAQGGRRGWISNKYLEPQYKIRAVPGAQVWIRSAPSLYGNRKALVGPDYMLYGTGKRAEDDRGVIWYEVALQDGLHWGYVSSKYTEEVK